jgi:hypothetical protein
MSMPGLGNVFIKGPYTATKDNLFLKPTHYGISLSDFTGFDFSDLGDDFESSITEKQQAEIESLVETEDYAKLAAYLAANFKQFFSVDKNYLWVTIPLEVDVMSELEISAEIPYFRFDTRLIMVLEGDLEEDDGWCELTLKE